MAVRLTYTGTPFADQIRQQGFRPGGIFSVAPGKIFSTTNPAFASTYGTPINLATSTRAFSLPSFNFTSGVSGREVIQSPEAATKGMRVAQTAERLKNVSPTAAKLLSGQTVSGFGTTAAPGFLKTAARTVLGPLSTVTLGPQVIAGLMAPSVMRGDFASDEDFQLGQSELGLGEFFTNQDFNQGFVSGAPGITNTSVANNLRQQMSSPRAMGAEDIGMPERRGILDFLKAGGAKVRDTFLQGMGAQGGLNIGARLGMLVNPALAIPGALLGAFFGARGVREATPGEKGIQSLYGGPNTIQQGATFIDPITGEEVESEMAGYNISSMFGKGLPSAIQSRIDRINRTLQKRQSTALEERRERLEAEKAAAEAAELAAQQRAVDAMFARGEGGSGQEFTGGRFDGASSREEYDAEPTAFSGSS